MEWSEALEVLKKRDIIHIPGGVNYLFLLKPKHFLIFLSAKKEFYRVTPGKGIIDRNDWEVDNKYREEINKLLKE